MERPSTLSHIRELRHLNWICITPAYPDLIPCCSNRSYPLLPPSGSWHQQLSDMRQLKPLSFFGSNLLDLDVER